MEANGITTIISAIISATIGGLVVIYGNYLQNYFQKRRDYQIEASRTWDKFSDNFADLNLLLLRDQLKGMSEEEKKLRIENQKITSTLAIYAPDEVVKSLSESIKNSIPLEGRKEAQETIEYIIKIGYASTILAMRQALSRETSTIFTRWQSIFKSKKHKEVTVDDIAPLLMF